MDGNDFILDGDGLAAFDFAAEQPGLTARAQRIAAARLASSTYSAKIEEPGWFRSPTTPSSHPDTVRPELFLLHQRYPERQYGKVVENGLVLLSKSRQAVGAEEVELLDLVLRASVRREEVVGPEVIEVARRYTAHVKSSPGLSYSAARVFAKASADLVLPLEAAEAVLCALSVHPSLPPYCDLLARLFAETHPTFAEILETPAKVKDSAPGVLEAEVMSVGLSDHGTEALQKVLGMNGEVAEDEEKPRDVRSL